MISAKRRCTKCNTIKPIAEFAPDTRYTFKRKSWCNSCVSGYQAEYAASEAGKEKRREAQRRYMQRLREGGEANLLKRPTVKDQENE